MSFTGVLAVFRRELASYFATPVAYVFIAVFLAMSSVCTFASELGGFFERGQADLRAFFGFHPWLYLFLVPASSMRLWAEDRRSGSIELLTTLPLAVWQSVIGKFLAAWAFVAVGLALTCPIWITVNFLGQPDNGVIAASYFGSLLLAGGFLAIGSFVSATTKNQIVAFVLSMVGCLMFMLLGFPLVQSLLTDTLPLGVTETLASLSVLTRYEAISRGVLAPSDVFYFATLIGVMLAATSILVELVKAD